MSAGIDPAAIATEVKLGRMLKENAPTKAMRYLVEGRCIIRFVDGERVLARVRGRGLRRRAPGPPWMVLQLPGSWPLRPHLGREPCGGPR